MPNKLLPTLGLALTLVSCGRSPSYETSESYSAEAGAEAAPQNKFGFQEALRQPSILPNLTPPRPERGSTEAVMAVSMPAAEGSTAASANTGEIPVGMPQVAYSYNYGFRIDSKILTPLQQQHADFCVSKGPRVCRIISMRQSGSSGDYAYGSLELAVVADQAREFGKQLTGSAERAGGEQISASIQGEDLSKKIVDTEARLRARTLLRDRLMEVLRGRKGTVAELVEAERGVAQVNEEIDQATSWLSEMKGRVEFSDLDISYESGERSSGGFWEPIRWALGSVGATLGSAIATVIMLLTALLPWALVLAGIVWVWRKSGFKLWQRKVKAKDSENTPDEPLAEG